MDSIMPKIKAKLIKQFWTRVKKQEGETACWEWTAGMSSGSSKYPDNIGPLFSPYGTGHVSARRIMFELIYGPVPEKYRVACLCGNDKCVRPEHLELFRYKDKFTPEVKYEGLANPKDPEPTRNQRIMPTADQLTQREISNFWSKVDKREDDECWPWTGSTTGGYGSIRIQGRAERATRIAYVIANGFIPSGHWVCHSCDNPICCNPRHLHAGIAVDNAKERWTRTGRKNNQTLLIGNGGHYE